MNKIKEDIKDEFKKDEFRFLIVADKYQTGFDQPLLFAMFLDKSISSPINAVQTLSRLNRTCPGKYNLPITVDFSNSYELIGKAFDQYMKSRTSERTDSYEDFLEIFENLLSRGIFTLKDLENFRTIVELDKDIFQTKYELFQNKIKDVYSKKDKIAKNEFRTYLGRFAKNFDWYNSIINIDNKNIATLGLFANQLYNKLSQDNKATFDIKKIISKIQLENFKIAPAKESNKEMKGGKKKSSGQVKEVAKLTINEIIETISEAFVSHSISKEGSKAFEEYLKTMVKDENIRKKILNTPKSEIEQNTKLLLKDLNKEISEYLFRDHYDIYEKLKDSDLLNQTNLHLIELINQDRQKLS